jgi:hypothetical protein
MKEIQNNLRKPEFLTLWAKSCNDLVNLKQYKMRSVKKRLTNTLNEISL